MFEEHDLVRASSTECMCNLVLSTEVRHIVEGDCLGKCVKVKLRSKQSMFGVPSGAEAVPGHRERSPEASCALLRRGG